MRKHTTAGDDFVQNREAIATNSPLFFIGCSPSQATKIINPDFRAAGVMVSINQLRDRISNFQVGDWILDSGAFTEVSRQGGFQHDVEQYYWQICRWSKCGNLLCAVAQDYMCEPFALARTGLTIEEHQKLTIKRYDQLIKLSPPVAIMPVLQGYQSSDYIGHLQQYSKRLSLNQWVGVGSVCKRNGKPNEIVNILKSIKLLRPDLRLHGFGLKILALESPEVRELLYSCDSMAWSYPLRFRPESDSVQKQSTIAVAHQYQHKVHAAVTDSAQKRVPRTAGAGNGQGRKPKWKSETVAIRVPSKYAEKLILIAKEWESNDSN